MAARRSNITISDIAAAAGVSIGAVSFALNGRKGVSDDTRARILKIADELGWAPASAAQSLASNRSQTVGLVLTRDPQNLGVETFFMRFIAGIESVCLRRSYGLLLQVADTPERELQTLRNWQQRQRVDGGIIVDVKVDDPRIRQFSEETSLPLVVAGDPKYTGELMTVWTDDAESMREAVRHLVDLGHSRIARVSGLSQLAHTVIRDQAFREEMEARGLEPIISRTDFSPAQGESVTRSLLETQPYPTAIIYDNDVMAVAGAAVAQEKGFRVPEDLSLVAWDDSVLCEHTFPKLTAMANDVFQFGTHVASRLFDLIDGAKPGDYLDSTPQLRVRESTGPAPKGPVPSRGSGVLPTRQTP